MAAWGRAAACRCNRHAPPPSCTDTAIALQDLHSYLHPHLRPHLKPLPACVPCYNADLQQPASLAAPMPSAGSGAAFTGASPFSRLQWPAAAGVPLAGAAAAPPGGPAAAAAVPAPAPAQAAGASGGKEEAAPLSRFRRSRLKTKANMEALEREIEEKMAAVQLLSETNSKLKTRSEVGVHACEGPTRQCVRARHASVCSTPAALSPLPGVQQSHPHTTPSL